MQVDRNRSFCNLRTLLQTINSHGANMKCSTITYLLSVAVTVFYSDSFHLSTQLKPMTGRSSKLAMKKTDDFSFPFKLLRRACVVGFAVALSGISVNDPFPLSISPPVAFAAAAATPAVGAPAPAFKLPSNLGKDLSLNDFPGKRIVLYFYPVSVNFIYLVLAELKRFKYNLREILPKVVLSKHKDSSAILRSIMTLVSR
jgi:hypothetical protein